MDLAKAARDPWVWGQLALFLLFGFAAPLLPRHVNLGAADAMLNRIDPDWIRWLGAAVMTAGGLVAAPFLWLSGSLETGFLIFVGVVLGIVAVALDNAAVGYASMALVLAGILAGPLVARFLFRPGDGR